MARLIDANALLEKVQFRLAIDNLHAEIIAGCVDITRRLIENAPTVDAVEVVRCKDCGAYNTDGCAEGFGWCVFCDRGMMDNDYCSHGGRRNNEVI